MRLISVLQTQQLLDPSLDEVSRNIAAKVKKTPEKSQLKNDRLTDLSQFIIHVSLSQWTN
jgi:hypothetical protein